VESLEIPARIEFICPNDLRYCRNLREVFPACSEQSATFAIVENLGVSSSFGQSKLSERARSVQARMKAAEALKRQRPGRFS
jgi:hypothetical protein